MIFAIAGAPQELGAERFGLAAPRDFEDAPRFGGFAGRAGVADCGTGRLGRRTLKLNFDAQALLHGPIVDPAGEGDVADPAPRITKQVDVRRAIAGGNVAFD